MAKINILNKEQFKEILSVLNAPEYVNIDYLHEVYENVVNGISDLVNSNDAFSRVRAVDQIEIIEYCIGEYVYSVGPRSIEERKAFEENEEFESSMVNVVADKYLTLSTYKHEEKKMTNRFIPPVSSLALYINFILNILNGYNQNDPKTTLLTDLLKKSSSIAKCTLGLLVDGFETEAFSSWRTLHECECTLILLNMYGDKLIDRYLRHMQFGLAFRDTMKDKDKQTEIFMAMKEEMKQYNLKSKDIKKYIEYGWAYSVPGVLEDETFKLNFRDGIEKVAGLSQYASRYEMSSEIIHGTPMLIYSSKEYFYYVTLLSLYESFFRLEKVFVNIFKTRVSSEVMKRYEDMRNLYYQQLVAIYKREMFVFNKWQEAHKKGN